MDRLLHRGVLYGAIQSEQYDPSRDIDRELEVENSEKGTVTLQKRKSTRNLDRIWSLGGLDLKREVGLAEGEIET